MRVPVDLDNQAGSETGKVHVIAAHLELPAKMPPISAPDIGQLPKRQFCRRRLAPELSRQFRGHPSPHPSPPREGEGVRPVHTHSHSGILSCFFFGMASALCRRVEKARMTRRLVPWGMMTSSMKPRSAATKGLAKRAS